MPSGPGPTQPEAADPIASVSPGSGGSATDPDVVLAEGGSAGDGAIDVGAGGAKSDAPLGGESAMFVPDVPNTYEGQIEEPGLEVIAHTLREGLFGYEWVVAVRNTGDLEDPICVIDIQSTFYDSSGAEIGSGIALLEHPLYRGCNGDCGFNNCLGAGEIGMATDQTGLLGLTDPSQIASVTHAFGAILVFDAVPTDDLLVQNVAITDDGFGGNVFTGELVNNSAASVTSPSISIFGTTAAGRPLLEATDSESTTIAPGGAWSFETGSFDETVADFVAFPNAID